MKLQTNPVGKRQLFLYDSRYLFVYREAEKDARVVTNTLTDKQRQGAELAGSARNVSTRTTKMLSC